MIEINNERVLITTFVDFPFTMNIPISPYTFPLRRKIEKCDRWIHIGKDGIPHIFKSRFGETDELENKE
jgi:hypothetical protein